MKPIQEQNFYEIFDIPSTATREQIEEAYALAKKTYSDDSLAAYSLFDAKERKGIRERVHQAYETLSNEGRRKRYDQEVLGFISPEPLAQPEAEGAQTSALARPSASSGTTDPALGYVLPDIESLTGAQLREFRERRNITLQEIVDKTRINITYFEFLEKDHYSALPPPVYLRSYLLQYARMLGLDPPRVADRILFLVEQAKKSKER